MSSPEAKPEFYIETPRGHRDEHRGVRRANAHQIQGRYGLLPRPRMRW